jgi:hypothetical protein
MPFHGAADGKKIRACGNPENFGRTVFSAQAPVL